MGLCHCCCSCCAAPEGCRLFLIKVLVGYSLGKALKVVFAVGHHGIDRVRMFSVVISQAIGISKMF